LLLDIFSAMVFLLSAALLRWNIPPGTQGKYF